MGVFLSDEGRLAKSDDGDNGTFASQILHDDDPASPEQLVSTAVVPVVVARWFLLEAEKTPGDGGKGARLNDGNDGTNPVTPVRQHSRSGRLEREERMHLDAIGGP